MGLPRRNIKGLRLTKKYQVRFGKSTKSNPFGATYLYFECTRDARSHAQTKVDEWVRRRLAYEASYVPPETVVVVECDHHGKARYGGEKFTMRLFRGSYI